MKKIGLGLMAVMLWMAVSARADDAAAEELRYRPDPSPAFCIARGVTNLATGWLEIPRCIIYDNTRKPVLGWFTGLGKGIGLTVTRAVTGVYDILSFGSSGDSLQSNSYPDLVFEAVWVPEKDAADE